MSEIKYTVFEKARLIGARGMQIAQGAPIAIELTEAELEKINYNPIEIAKLELAAGKLPLEVKRPKAA